MDSETVRQVKEVLEDLENGLVARIPRARDRSPETLMDEIEAQDLVLDLKSRLEFN